LVINNETHQYKKKLDNKRIFENIHERYCIKFDFPLTNMYLKMFRYLKNHNGQWGEMDINAYASISRCALKDAIFQHNIYSTLNFKFLLI